MTTTSSYSPDQGPPPPPTYVVAVPEEPPLLTYALLGVIAAVFLLQQSSSERELELLRDGALYAEAIQRGNWWQLITPAFLHADWLHVGFNSVLLYQIGASIERGVGRLSYALIFFGAVIGGSFGALYLSGAGAVTIGASGGVFGLFGAFAAALLLRGQNPLTSSIGPLLIINLVFTFTGNGISIGGHIGGLIAGGLIGMILLRARDTDRHAAGVGVATAIVGGLVLASISLVNSMT